MIGECLRTLWMRVLGGPKILVTVDGGNKEKGGEFFDGGQPWVENWKKSWRIRRGIMAHTIIPLYLS